MGLVTHKSKAHSERKLTPQEMSLRCWLPFPSETLYSAFKLAFGLYYGLIRWLVHTKKITLADSYKFREGNYNYRSIIRRPD